VANETGRRQSDCVGNLEQFLNALVSDEVPHGGSVVSTDYHTSIESDTQGARSCLDDICGLVH
jgi:hypothetical protein